MSHKPYQALNKGGRINNYIQTEYEEALILADYCRAKKYKFAHINNEIYTKSWKQKAKMTAQGTAAGVPDYMIVVNNKLIFIELKRTKGGVVSLKQKEWINTLEQANVPVAVCKGANDAIAFIESML